MYWYPCFNTNDCSGEPTFTFDYCSIRRTNILRFSQFLFNEDVNNLITFSSVKCKTNCNMGNIHTFKLAFGLIKRFDIKFNLYICPFVGIPLSSLHIYKAFSDITSFLLRSWMSVSLRRFVLSFKDYFGIRSL